MSIRIEGDLIRIIGRCEAEDAEPLLAALGGGAATVDLGECEHMHAAILQLLMAAKPKLLGTPSPFLERWILPVIEQVQGPPPDAVQR